MNKFEFYHPILTKFFSEWESELQGCNYSVHLGFEVVNIKNKKYEPLDILVKMYPNDNMKHVILEEVQSDSIVRNIIIKILNKDPEYGLPKHYSNSLIKKINNYYKSKLQNHIRSFVTLNQTKAYKCKNLPNFPHEDFWEFHYLLIDEIRNISILIYGGASS